MTARPCCGPAPRARAAGTALAAILAWACLPAQAPAQAAGEPQPRWRIEVAGAMAGLGPSDLNAAVVYETAIVDHLRDVNVQQTHEGALRSIDRAVPIGARVLRTFGHRWSAGAGVSWFDVTRRSSAAASYAFTEVDPKAQYHERAFSETIAAGPVEVAAREFFAHAVIRYDWIARPRLRLGTSILAGWIAAECRAERARTIDGGYYPRNRASSVSMDGRGSGLGGDAVLTARVAVTRRLGVLAEAGYAWHEVRTITGSSTTTTVVQDGEAAEVELAQTSAAEGRWLNQPVSYQTGTGVWRGTVPAIRGGGSAFTLSLSGWRFTVGVTLGL